MCRIRRNRIGLCFHKVRFASDRKKLKSARKQSVVLRNVGYFIAVGNLLGTFDDLAAARGALKLLYVDGCSLITFSSMLLITCSRTHNFVIVSLSPSMRTP